MHSVAVPTPVQDLLIRAALEGPVDGGEYLDLWAERVEFDDIDHASRRLLPLLYHTHGADLRHPDAGRIKGVYKRAWMRNQRIKAATRTVIDDLEALGIDTVILKGLSLVERAYFDLGARSMSDADLLVHPDAFWDAEAHLRTSGWTIKGRERDHASHPQFHGIGFTNDEGLECDLHWSVYNVYGFEEGEDDLLAACVPIQGYGERTTALSSADELLHVMVHGLQWNAFPPIRWIPDAVLLLRNPQASIDWDRLISQAVERRLTLPAAFGLDLATSYGAVVPREVVEGLNAIPVGATERYEWWARQQSIFGLRLPTDYIRSTRSDARSPTPAGLYQFYQSIYPETTLQESAVRFGRAARKLAKKRPYVTDA